MVSRIIVDADQSQKKNNRGKMEHEHILSGIIKCPICGHGLSGTVRRRKNKKTGDYVDDFYYRCQHRHKIDDEHFCNFQPSLNQNDFNHEVEQVILDMVNHDGFRKFVEDRLNTKVDVSALEEERERIRRLLRQVMGAKISAYPSMIAPFLKVKVILPSV